MKYIGLHRPDGATAEVQVHNELIYQVRLTFPKMTSYVDHRYDGCKPEPAIEQMESWGWIRHRGYSES